MVEYYNMSKFSTNEGFMSFFKTFSELSGGWFGIFMLALFFTISTYAMIDRGKNVIVSFNVSSLYTAVLASFLYMGGIIENSLAIYTSALIFITTLIIRFYHK